MSRAVVMVTATMLIISSVIVCSARAAAPPQKPEAFYKGSTIKLVVNSTAGSGADLSARVFAQYLGQAIGAIVVINNMGGAGGMEGLNATWRAKPDGLNMGFATFAPFVAMNLMKDPGALYQVEKFGYLGCIGKETDIFWVKGDGPIKSIADLKAMKGGRFLSLSPTHIITIGLCLICNILDLDAKVSTGGTTGEAQLSVIQGNSPGYIASPGDVLNNLAKGWKPFFTFDTTRTPIFPDLPAMPELVKISKDQLDLIQLKASIHSGRVIYLPPGTGNDKVLFLQDAFRKIVQQKEYRADVEKLVGRKDVPFPDGNETLNNVNGLKAKGSFLQDRFKSLIKQYTL